MDETLDIESRCRPVRAGTDGRSTTSGLADRRRAPRGDSPQALRRASRNATARGEPAGWPRRRKRSTPTSTSISPGRSSSCPSASGRSTSIGCTRTSASSSRSWSRCCSTGTSCADSAYSIRSPARARRWCRRSSAACTRRLRRRRLQLPADARQDRPLRPVPARVGASRLPAPLRGGEGIAGEPRRSCAPGTRRRRSTSCSASARCSTSTRTQTCSASCSRVPPARRGGRRTSTSTSRACRSSSPYWCHKHRRECRPVEKASKFLRDTRSTRSRGLKEFARLRGAGEVSVLHGDARSSSSKACSTRCSPRRRIRA